MQVVTLGPAGTFSEIAARAFCHGYSASAQLHPELTFEASLQRTLSRAQQDANIIAVVPIENIAEGFVSPVVDALLRHPLNIIAEFRVPVRFSYVSHHPRPAKIYAQFVAQGQCSEFISARQQQTDPPTLVTTGSNIEALDLFFNDANSAALVPTHSTLSQAANLEQKLITHHVADYPHNETRFIAVSQQRLALDTKAEAYKTSLLLIDDSDHPGLLADHLQVLAKNHVNLTSIVSRPTGTQFGNYHFFLDADGHQQDPHLASAIATLQAQSRLVVLGSYPSAKQVLPFGD